MTKADIYIAVAVLAVAALFFFVFRFLNRDDGGEGHLIACIYVDGDITDVYNLDKASEDGEDIVITSGYGTNIVSLRRDGVFVKEADCGHQDCMRTGKITRGGQIIACLPHRLLVRLQGGKEYEVDAVAR